MTAKLPLSPDKSEKSAATTRSSQSSVGFTTSPSFTSPPFGSAGGSGSGGGFFSLGESNIAERARKLKEERQNSMKVQNKKNASVTKINAGEENGDASSVVSKASKDGDTEAPRVKTEAERAAEKAELKEFDFLLISNQAGETENVLHKSLVQGFRSLAENRLQQALDNDDALFRQTKEQRVYFATVNFIDPTTRPKPSAATAPPVPTSVSDKPAKSTNLLQQQSMLSKRAASNSSQASNVSAAEPPAIENVYENLTHIFEKEFGSTIRSVPYKNSRTGEVHTIRTLPLRPVITVNGSTRGSSSSSSSNGSIAAPLKDPGSPNNTINTPWGGSASAMLPVSDPSEWHTGPFCHVYIAACENFEHYRTKVRPSLKAFVSQLESSDSNTAANQQGGHSADYLIVYVPVGDDSNKSGSKKGIPAPSSNKPNANNGRRGFFGIGQRFAGGASQASDAGGDGDDLSSKDSVDSDDGRLDMSNQSGMDSSGDDSESGAINVLRSFGHLSKLERSLYKKIATNFPNGKVCVLSRTSLQKAFGSEDRMAIRVQEWTIFNRLLGQVVVNGFQDRIKRYKAELKRLDAQRATAATAAKNYAISGSIGNKSPATKPNPYAFNLGHFFLVKESLASSFEQMQLPGEALLQYDEFRMYMPDLSDKEESKVRRARRKSKALLEDTPSERLTSVADAGDFLGFRKKIRKEYDLTAILDILRRYLFARELSLLFRMEQPVEVLNRCQSFIKVMHSILLRGISELDEEDQQERKSKAATWVVQFSWDICCATKEYLSSSAAASQESNQKQTITHSDETIGAKLSDILEISRLFLIQLAGDHTESLEPFSIRRNNFPKDLQSPWPPWTPRETPNDEDETNKTSHLGEDILVGSEDGKIERQILMNYEDNLTSIDEFEKTYLKLCEAIISTRQVARHHRQAARIQAEIGEYYVSTGDLRKAASSFQNIVKVYRMDHWDRCHFWRVFRLAYCQRTSVGPAAYLKTLCSCFSPRSAMAAPKKALLVLFEDLKLVIGHPTIGNARYSRLLFIETSMSLSTSSGKPQMRTILDQKTVEERSCSVGESIQIPITIKSHLPGPIDLTSVKLFAVTHGTFKSIFASGDAVQEEDAAKVLSITNPIELKPGKNDYSFEWSPPTSGQYILSTVEILWKEGYFYYDSMDLNEPLLSLNVVPNEPTHSILVEPAELVPGHDQEVRITFDAGSDYITSVKVILAGTMDVVLIPPGEDPKASEWRQDWITDLEPFKPGEKQVMTARVRCALEPEVPELSGSEDEDENPVQRSRGLVAKALTTYQHAPTEAGDKSSDSLAMESGLKFFAPVLEKTALSVESLDTHWLDEAQERFLLSIVLASNAECHMKVDEWNLNLVSPIKLSGEDNLSENLLHRSVWDGDQLSFVFECSIDPEPSDEAATALNENRIHLKLCDDEGKKFRIDLPLDLRAFCSRLQCRNGSSSRKPSSSTITATLTLDDTEGLVGEPLGMTFVVKTSDDQSSNSGSRFVYSIGCTKGHWLLGGKLNGLIDCSQPQTLMCVGVPVVLGVLKDFPTITIERLDDSLGSTIPISVECQQPEAFRSMPMTEINAIATPR